ncbi:hypothetical protein [Thiohalorhabdus methylotrophus]|uniref:Uncharacterized protein n=1 Tax=Thiohalorhabdus methylotrophus TaxID=3242694 RepID=A0ABV4TZK5_9GAMM
MAQKRNLYPGIHNDRYGGMTDAGLIIRDAWVFEILPETETCEGWDYGRLENLYGQVSEAWEPYGHLVSNLPPELRERHERIHSEGLRKAREAGWKPDHSGED